MTAETAKLKIEEQSREELIALIYEMAKEISELKSEIARMKQHRPHRGIHPSRLREISKDLRVKNASATKRKTVIHRKVMGSFRSNWGAHAYAALATVLNTAKRNGHSAFQKLVQWMGKPVLPFLYYYHLECDQLRKIISTYQSVFEESRHKAGII